MNIGDSDIFFICSIGRFPYVGMHCVYPFLCPQFSVQSHDAKGQAAIPSVIFRVIGVDGSV